MRINGCEMSLADFERAEDLTVQGHLNLAGSLIERVPDGLIVMGNLYLDDCKRLREIGKVTVGGHMSARECALTAIWIFVGVRDCEAFSTACGCHDLAHLPDMAIIDGEADFRGCHRLRGLPNGMRVEYIAFSLISGVQAFPKDMTITGDLDISDCEWVTEIPRNLTVRNSIYAVNCVNLQKIPEEMCLLGNLVVTGCTSLTEIPMGVIVGRDLLANGSEIRKIGERVSVGRDLICSGTDIEEIPASLSVGGRLDAASFQYGKALG